MRNTDRRSSGVAYLLVTLLVASLALSVPTGAQAAAKSGRECYPRTAPDHSLIVRGKMTCQQGKRLFNASIELAAATQRDGRRKFHYKGFRCVLRNGHDIWYTCRDRDGKPRRSFTIKYV